MSVVPRSLCSGWFTLHPCRQSQFDALHWRSKAVVRSVVSSRHRPWHLSNALYSWCRVVMKVGLSLTVISMNHWRTRLDRNEQLLYIDRFRNSSGHEFDYITEGDAVCIIEQERTNVHLSTGIARALLPERQKPSFKLVVVYDTKIKGQNFEEEHSHESAWEANTLIPHQVLASMTDKPWREVFVWSADTDVFILLLHLASSGRLNSLKLLTGRDAKFRIVL